MDISFGSVMGVMGLCEKFEAERTGTVSAKAGGPLSGWLERWV